MVEKPAPLCARVHALMDFICRCIPRGEYGLGPALSLYHVMMWTPRELSSLWRMLMGFLSGVCSQHDSNCCR